MNGSSSNSILIAICVVAIGAMVGASIKQESAVQIIGFGSMICVSLLAVFHQMKAADRQEKKLDAAAKRVEDVKQTLAVNTANTEGKLDNLVNKVDEVHLATNSLTDRSVESTAKESHAAGMKAEREREREAVKIQRDAKSQADIQEQK